MSENINDDDDFGDFEEASFEEEETGKQTVDSIPIDESGDASRECFLESSSSQPLNIDLLPGLLEDADIWSIDESSTGDEQLQRDDNLFDLFSHFGSEQSLVPDNTKQAIELWSGLHVVEETNALNFRWNSSQLYSHFIEALNSYGAQGSAADSSVPKTGSLVSEGFSVNRSIDGGLNEWTLPEYGQNNEIDWDFFQTESNRSGPSVLDQELKALGLAPQPKSSITKPALNGTTNHKETHVNPRYLSVSELNEEAQSFYARIPDISFLLVDRVRNR